MTEKMSWIDYLKAEGFLKDPLLEATMKNYFDTEQKSRSMFKTMRDTRGEEPATVNDIVQAVEMMQNYNSATFQLLLCCLTIMTRYINK